MRMTFLLAILIVGAALFVVVKTARAGEIERISAQEAHRRVASGEAVLIDVREADEWKEGVAAPALLLALSDLNGTRATWKAPLAENKDKELILYCRSGNRSGKAAAVLAKEGYKVTNAGAFASWQEAGLPVKQP